jgi:hypothetical protein
MNQFLLNVKNSTTVVVEEMKITLIHYKNARPNAKPPSNLSKIQKIALMVIKYDF